MIAALVGQPNSGKSTIFSSLSGVVVKTSNFPGTTVNYFRSFISYKGKKIEIFDLPGIYSFFTDGIAERTTLDFILKNKVDVIINVIDASVLSRSLELTIELSELQIPMIVVLNMMDEAKKKGIKINSRELEEILGVPVVETIASRGIGIEKIVEKIEDAKVPRIFEYEKHVEDFLKLFPSRREAILFLEGLVSDERFLKLKEEFISRFGDPYLILSDERHKISLRIFEKVSKVEKREKDWRDNLDNFLLNPFSGYVFMILVFFTIFFLSFYLGNLISEHISILEFEIEKESFELVILSGIFEGFFSVVEIVVPYMLPLLILLGILEDLGYLPRAAFLLDRFFHKIGLHGKAAATFLVGYGCSVPAVMATRILEDPKDRLKAAVLIPLIPCSARTVIILAIVAGIFGFHVAIFLYFFNIFILAFAGTLLNKILRGGEFGMLMEIPSLKIPSLKVVLNKVRLTLYDFLIYAFPIILAGNVFLSVLEYYGFEEFMNSLTKPITFILALPEELGFTMIFGIFRKELALLMTLEAFNLSDVSEISKFMTFPQIFTYVLFLMLYIPCISTVAVLFKEIGIKYTFFALLFNFSLALLFSFLLAYSSIFWNIVFQNSL
ncbi:MAG: ferrous iron transport protein B [Archaeoglobaceae archaeon]|nr:ferrous iron transport protein B [Archaeoglobaceae archaeon]MDW8014015.1 ferrous iron transport protein B [Archaeoglobaceae archaeon]